MRVNGAIVRELATRVGPDDRVELRGAPVAPPPGPTYLLINKPLGVVTTMRDPQGRRTIAELLPAGPRVVPVGRLDYATGGALLLTDDGDLAHRLLHPRFGVDKTYRAQIAGRLSAQAVRRLIAGISLDDGRTAGAKVRVLAVRGDRSLIDVTIREGRNRQVRRMFEALGHPVLALTRIRFGPLRLGALSPGHVRALTDREIEALRRHRRPPSESPRTTPTRGDDMNRSIRIVAVAIAALLAAANGSARAQYSNEFVQAKLIHEGTTTKPIAGSGHVVVQVQVNADGSHKAIKVISSTNAGDNDAAMEIAQSSSYRPARRGSTPITAFYDFTLRFVGKSLARAPSSNSGTSLPASGSLSPAANQVAALIREGKYAQAKSKAETEMLSSPGDESLREMLGIAAYDGGDFTTAAAAFDKVPVVGAQFRAAAAQSFAAAAVKVASSDASLSLAYAQKAVALDPGTNSHFALGVAQLVNNDTAAALQTLKAAHDTAMRDSKIPVASKVNIDAELLQAYLANGDLQEAQGVAAQIKQLDPSSTAGAQAMAASLIKSGQAAEAAKDTATALKDFDQAAALGDPGMTVTANVSAAFAVAQGAKPDYKLMQSYADKAIALKPDDAQANFAEGIALTGIWASSHDDGTKTKAAAALARADQQAKSEGNEGLALQIETFVKTNLNGTPAAKSGAGP